ncbi:MAG: 2-dehydro-3-deoxygalactonokinase [Bacteroidia bacterium]
MQTQFLSCDWGTSSFRLSLVSAADGAMICSRSTPDGVGVLFRRWKGEGETEDRQVFFLRYLGQQVELLKKACEHRFSPEKIIVSGMASASIGMCELPYAVLPFSLSGENLVSSEIYSPDLCPFPVKLISGVRSADDIMRGEETQMLGLREKIGGESAICILPGTHSKHIAVSGSKITGFHTWMTGEVFQLLATQSILAASVNGEAPGWDETAFREGILLAQNQPLLQTIFSVRTGNLFGKRNLTSGYHYLSGLLIGSEIAGLNINPSQRILLSAPEKMRNAYTIALEMAGYGKSLMILASEENNQLAIEGQRQIFSSVY